MAAYKIFKRGKAAIARSILIVLLIGLIFLMVSCRQEEQKAEPTGGEIYPSDFADGVKVYIEEGYSAKGRSILFGWFHLIML